MDRRSSQEFCTQCGTRMPPDARYCPACGAAAVATSTAPSPNTEAPPPAPSHGPRAKGRGIHGRLFGTWAVVALLIAVSGFGYGWMHPSGDQPHTIHLSPEQNEALTGYGHPDAWVIADGPTLPDGGIARIEQWYHFDEHVIVTFVNGTATDAKEFTDTEGLLPANGYGPFDFDPTLTRTAVDEMLGEPGTPIHDVESPFPDYRAYGYASARLLIGYLGDQCYTAQTF